MCGHYIFLLTNSDVKGTLKQTSSSTKIQKVLGVNWATWQISCKAEIFSGHWAEMLLQLYGKISTMG